MNDSQITKRTATKIDIPFRHIIPFIVRNVQIWNLYSIVWINVKHSPDSNIINRNALIKDPSRHKCHDEIDDSIELQNNFSIL